MSLKKLMDVFELENRFKSLQVGEVVENIDPLNLGRVKINIPNFTEGVSTDVLPWSHQIFPVGTGGADSIPTFKVPAIGTQLVVMFPTDDIYSSFYIGELLFKSHKLDVLLEDYPETYGFIDKIKNKYWVNMKKGTVDIHHHSGTHVKIDKDGTINVTGVVDLNIDIAENSTITIGKNSNVTIGENSTIDVGGDASVTIGGDATMDVGGKMDVSTGGEYNISAGGPFSVSAPKINLN